MRLDQASRRSWCGAFSSSRRISLRQCLQRPRRTGQRTERLARALLRFSRFGQLDRPGLLLPGVHLEKAGAVKAPGEAISGAPDGEFLVARAHEGLARPFAAAVVVNRVDVVGTRREISTQQRFAIARPYVPPSLGRPAFAVLVANCNADSALGQVAHSKISGSRCCYQ